MERSVIVNTKHDKGLHKAFKAVVNDIYQALPILVESGSEVSYFIPEHRNATEVTRLPEDTNKPWLKATMKEINNLINNENVLVQEPGEGETVTPCMDVYKTKNQSDISIDKLKLRIVVRGDL